MSQQDGYKLLVAGSRDFTAQAEMFRVLDALVSERKPVAVITGGAPGADRMAAAWAEARGIESVVVNAVWRKPDGAKDAGAGYRRNEKMVNMLLVCDRAVVFYGPAGESAGSRHTAGLLRVKGVPTRIFNQSKPVMTEAEAQESETFKAIDAMAGAR